MLDQLFEIKTCRDKNLLKGHSICPKECEGLFATIDPKQNSVLVKKESTVIPIEMTSIHVEKKKQEKRFGFFEKLKRKN